jgi:nucleoid DNA-binding protein
MSDAKIKLKSIETGQIISVHPVDAKEILASGNYECIGEAPEGKAEWLPEVAETNKKIELEGDITEESINNMTSKMLEDLLKEQDIKVKDFDKMNLKDKRVAVIKALSESAEEL